MIIPVEDKASVISSDTAVEIPPGKLEGRDVKSTCSVDMCAKLNRWMPMIFGLIVGAAICAVTLYGGIKKHEWSIAAAGIGFGCVVMVSSVFYKIYCLK
jgi:hypothetical protein